MLVKCPKPIHDVCNTCFHKKYKKCVFNDSNRSYCVNIIGEKKCDKCFHKMPHEYDENCGIGVICPACISIKEERKLKLKKIENS